MYIKLKKLYNPETLKWCIELQIGWHCFKLTGFWFTNKKPLTCYFSTDITDQLSCSQISDFDHNGFPVHVCPLYPCKQYKKIC